MTDPFPVEDFDGWAKDYDQSVASAQSFPFTGYAKVLNSVVELADPQPGMQVLDLGIGTGNLALRFDARGCEIWGSDFSAAMLEKAYLKLPKAHLFQVDLRGDWPPELSHRFDCIVSAYVFHHFKLDEKIKIVDLLAHKHLKAGGKLLIADIAFQNQAALEAVKSAAGDEWDDEFYWLADEAIPALQRLGLNAAFHRISNCAGVFETS